MRTFIALLLVNGIAFAALPESDRGWLEELEQHSVRYFWEQANPAMGLVLDRSTVNGGRANGPGQDIASSSATGFGLTALCIGAEHGWIPHDQALERARRTLEFFAYKAYQDHGWFYHWMDISTGASRWDSELSSIDTALFLGGVLTAGQCFAADPEISKLSKLIYERVDFQWMMNGDPLFLSHGFVPGSGFLKYKWDVYSEASILYLLGIGSPTFPIPAGSWYAWERPMYTYGPFHFISGGPLFTHQYSHAWVDFRNRRDRGLVDFFQNSVAATRANQLYSLNLRDTYPASFTPIIWGITASDGPKGYKIYSEITNFQPVDGTVAPCAAGGSLMFTPDISVPALRAIRDHFGDSVYGKYGFVDAYNPTAKWFDTDVIGIDVGITLLSAENLLTGNVWKWFMAAEPMQRAMDLAGFSRPPEPQTEPKPAPPPVPPKVKPAPKRARAPKHAKG